MYESELSQGSWSGLLPVLLPRRPARWWCLSPWKDPWVFHHVRSCKATVCSPGLWSARSQGSVWDGFSGSYRKSGERKQDGFLFFAANVSWCLCAGTVCAGVFYVLLCLFVLVGAWSQTPLFCSEIKEKEREQSVSSSQVTVKANQTKTNRSRRAEVTEMIPRQNNNFFSPKIRLETRSSSCRWWVQTDALKRLNSVFCFKSVLFSIKATFNGYCRFDLTEPF